EMRAGAMNLVRDIVPGPMREVLREPCRTNHFARCIICLEAPYSSSLCESFLHRADRRVTRVAYRFKDLLLALARFAANDAGPGDVVENAFSVIGPAPDVDEKEVALLNFGCSLSGGLVVGV